MKVLVCSFRKEEAEIFIEKNKELGLTLDYMEEPLSLANSDKTIGYDGIVILTNCVITAELAHQLKLNGLKFIASRAAGTDHLDLQALKKEGIKTANVPSYSPSAISEHTVLLVLALLRKLKYTIEKVEACDFSLAGLRGRELKSLTVGVIGTGRIGAETIALLHGFGSRVLAYDVYPKESIKEYAEYVTLPYLYENSDVIVFHCPLTNDNYHMLNQEALNQCKDGVIIVNTARGGLMDIEAVKAGVQSGKIGAFGFDVYEEEIGYLRHKVAKEEFELRDFAKLSNVIYTPHVSFFTDTSIKNMIETSLDNLKEFDLTNECKNELHI